jgi:hypothetical protein
MIKKYDLLKNENMALKEYKEKLLKELNGYEMNPYES